MRNKSAGDRFENYIYGNAGLFGPDFRGFDKGRT